MLDLDQEQGKYAGLTDSLCKAVLEHAEEVQAPSARLCTAMVCATAAIAATIRSSLSAEKKTRDVFDQLTRRWEKTFAELMDRVRHDDGTDLP